MKKILWLVTFVFFLISSYLVFDYSSKLELSNLLSNDEYYVNISSKTTEGVLETIIDTSNEYNVNVQKSVYRLQEKGSFVIDIFTHNNKQDVFYKNLIVKSGDRLTIDSPSSSYLSTKPSNNDDNNIGVISLLDKANVINIKKLSDADKENLNGIYYFTGVKNDKQFNQIVSSLTEHGINIEDNQSLTKTDIVLDMNVLSFIPLIFLLVIITAIYKYIMEYKEISVMMLNGYSYRDIIRKKGSYFLLTNSIIAILITVITICIHYAIYGVAKYHLYLLVLVLSLILDIVLTLAENICAFVIKSIDITICLRNQKPQKQINIVNIIAKVCFSFLIIFLATNSAIKIKEFNEENYNLEAWQESIHYAFTAFSRYEPTANNNTFEIGLKCQKLYSLLDEKGAMLMRVSGYYSANPSSRKMADENQPKDTSETVEVNNNFLAKNPIYDLNGKKVMPIPLDEDILTILIPEKYLPIKEEIEKWYIEGNQEIRYFDENLYNEETGGQQIDKKQDVRFQYIKNGQKLFSYDPEVNPESNNYITDPVITLTNPVNRGTDVYFSMMTGGDLLINISNPSNPYNEVFPYINEAGLKNEIKSTPTVFSRVDQKQYELGQILNKYIFMLIISFIGYIVITIFITLNHVESNKEINVIKKLFGYSFIKRNSRYYLLSLIPVVVLTPLFMFAYRIIAFNVLILLALSMIDVITISVSLYVFDKTSMNDVLKGS